MRDQALSVLRHLAKTLGYGAAGAFLMLLVGFVLFVDSQPDLAIWHRVELDQEFVEHSAVEDFAGYLELEQRLFEQLEARVLDRIEPEQRHATNRYHRGSSADPGLWPHDWNRSFELTRDAPHAGVLLLHGMTDSPYSLRKIGERLHRAGAHVIGLRIPGHGTAPAGLTEVRWQDMAAAVRIAARHLEASVGDVPLTLVGYSNGGALAVQYTLEALEDDSLARFDRLVLLSPEIGVSPAAAFAVWQKRIGRLLGLEKLEWHSVLPEYDPFKYQSFAINAGDQVYRLTCEISRQLDALSLAGKLDEFPRALVFQSAVDATVSTPAVIEQLMDRLPPNGHELVLFDLNRVSGVEPLLSNDPRPGLAELLRDRDLPFALSVVTNSDATGPEVSVRHKPAGHSTIAASKLGLAWPHDVFSLSHVALPFSAEDPLYGVDRDLESPRIHLGALALRGENSVLEVTPAAMLRQRWNPFYSWMERRILEFVGLP
jgi:alpha-beta hydrolase superfamily lysophospholipase